MLAIKFQRQGKKHQAHFRLVVAEKRSKADGKFVDDLGWFDPHSKKFEIKKDKIEHWLKVGAQPTPSTHNLLVRAEIIDKPKIAVHSTKSKKQEESAPAEGGAVAPVAETPAAPAEPQKEATEVAATEKKEEVKEETKTE